MSGDSPIPQTTGPGMTDYLVRQALAEPMVWDWGQNKAVHEWRSYVTDEVKAVWPTFTPAQKVAVMRMLDGIASQEEWD